MDSAVHRINLYPVSDAIGPPGTYLLDSDFEGGYGYSTVPFETITAIFWFSVQ